MERRISSYIIQSQEEEIKRIATELHEGVGQTLYSLYTGLQLIEGSVEQPSVKNYMKDMTRLLENTIQEIRLLTIELHPPTLTTLGLVPAIKSYLKLYTSTFGIVVKTESIGKEKNISESQSIAVFRVCQEALANIAKYADACEAHLMMIWKEDSLKIEISDRGKGFEYDKRMKQSSGLAAMEERMFLIGGACEIFSAIGEGTTVQIVLPI